MDSSWKTMNITEFKHTIMIAKQMLKTDKVSLILLRFYPFEISQPEAE